MNQIELNIGRCKGSDYLELSFLSLNKLINRDPLSEVAAGESSI